MPVREQQLVHERTKGSRHMLKHAATGNLLVIPERREVPRGTLRSILERAGLSAEQFLVLAP